MREVIPDRPTPVRRRRARRIPILALFVLLVGLAVHARLATGPHGIAVEGRLRDTDAYVRTMRVEALRRTGDWYATDIARLNAPYGLSMHWTRPLDVLILGPALVAERLAGVDARRAIFWSGALSAPLQHIAAAFAAAWAAAALWPGTVAWFAALTLIGTPPIAFGYGRAGFTDHHMLILIAAVVGLGAALRAALEPRETGRAAIGAGLAFALGVWVSPEALLVAGPALAAFGLAWLVAPDGTPFGRQGMRIAGAMLAGLAVAVAVEQPPARWLVGEYDKVSAQHVLIAALAAGSFAMAMRFGASDRARRLALGAGLAGGAVAVLLALYPRALSGSLAGADAGSIALFLPMVREMQPLAPTREGLFDLLAWAGVAAGPLLALPIALLAWARDGRRWPAWLVLALPFAVTLAATMTHRRFVVDLAAVSGIAGAGLVWFALRLPGRMVRALAVAAAIAVVTCTPYLALLMPHPNASGESAEHACRTDALARWLVAARPGAGPSAPGDADPIILTASPDITPELAYLTPYRYVSAPYHRGGAAFEDTVAVFTARDEATARAVLDRRGVRFILLCLRTRPPNLGPMHPESLEARLRGSGDPPPWLRPLALPPELDGTYRMFEVLR